MEIQISNGMEADVLYGSIESKISEISSEMHNAVEWRKKSYADSLKRDISVLEKVVARIDKGVDKGEYPFSINLVGYSIKELVLNGIVRYIASSRNDIDSNGNYTAGNLHLKNTAINLRKHIIEMESDQYDKDDSINDDDD